MILLFITMHSQYKKGFNSHRNTYTHKKNNFIWLPGVTRHSVISAVVSVLWFLAEKSLSECTDLAPHY